MTTGKLVSFLPYGAHFIDDDDCRAVVEVLKSDRLTCGPMVDAFEKTMCDMTGARYAVSCANGTAGLHLASLAMGIEPGDKVIVPTITFLATANAPRWCGADIVFADVDDTTGLMTPQHFEEAIVRAGGKVKAVFPVHIAGHVCDMEAINSIAKRNGIMVVEDACHALGTRYQGQQVGGCQFSDMTMFSFHPVKNAAMGEGGVITTNDYNLYQKMVHLRGHGMERDCTLFTNKDIAFDANGVANPWYYEMQEIGLNYRLTDIQCALGISQLKKLEFFKTRRQELRALYCEKLSSFSELIEPMTIAANSDPCWHIFVTFIDFDKLSINKADIIRELYSMNIGAQVHYTPVHMQPYYRRLAQPDLPSAMNYYRKALTLPLHISMTEDDVVNVVDNLIDILQRNRRTS